MHTSTYRLSVPVNMYGLAEECIHQPLVEDQLPRVRGFLHGAGISGAFLMRINFSAAAVSGFLSGWYFSESLWKAFLGWQMLTNVDSSCSKSQTLHLKMQDMESSEESRDPKAVVMKQVD